MVYFEIIACTYEFCSQFPGWQHKMSINLAIFHRIDPSEFVTGIFRFQGMGIGTEDMV